MTGLATIRTSLEQCYDAIEALAGRMNATQWLAQSLCPDWDMPGVIAHPPRRPGRADRRRPGQAVLDASRAAHLRGVPGDADLRLLGARA